jgi:hypothetical protein
MTGKKYIAPDVYLLSSVLCMNHVLLQYDMSIEQIGLETVI